GLDAPTPSTVLSPRATYITAAPRSAGRSRVPLWPPHAQPATSPASASIEDRRVTDSPRLRLRLALRPRDALRLARSGSQTRLAARVAEPPRPPLGSHDQDHRLASRRASPSLRGRRSARTTTFIGSPRSAGPQPRDALRLARPGSQTRLAARVAEPPRPPLGSHYHTAASSRDRRYQGASGKVIGRIAGSVTPASRYAATYARPAAESPTAPSPPASVSGTSPSRSKARTPSPRPLPTSIAR